MPSSFTNSVSVASALTGVGSVLRGLQAQTDGGSVRIDSIGFESEACAASGLWTGTRGGVAAHEPCRSVQKVSLVARGEITRGGVRRALVSRDDRVRPDSPLLGLLSADDGPARAAEALTAWLADFHPGEHHDDGASIDAGCELVDALASALLPHPDAASLFGWVRHAFAPWARDPEGHLAEVTVDGTAWTLDFAGNLQAEVSVLDWGMVYARVEIRHEGETVFETSLPPARLSLEALSLPAPDPDAVPVRALRTSWRAHLAEQLRQLAVAFDAGEQTDALDALSRGESIIAVLESWAVDGPPPACVPRVQSSDESVRRAAGSIRKLAGADLVSVGRHRVCATAAYALGSDLILLRARGSGATEDDAPDDEIWLQRGTDRAVPLLARPAHAEFSRCIDGDAEAMRGVLSWLRATIVKAGCDATFHERNFGAEWAAEALAELDALECMHESESPAVEAPAVRKITISEWLRFERWPGHPTYDWRCPNDEIDGARSLLDDDAMHAPAAARRDDVARYYDFIRRWIDPRFVGRMERS